MVGEGGVRVRVKRTPSLSPTLTLILTHAQDVIKISALCLKKKY
jgi:hypothetical protein